MDDAFERLAEARDEEPLLHIEQRELRARRRAGGVVWFDFKTLCGGPRSQNDYLELAAQFHTVLLSDVPQMPPRLASEARRFTWLVDVLYDRRVKLIISAAVPPDAALHRRSAGARVPAHRVAAERDAVGRVTWRWAARGRYVADMNELHDVCSDCSGAAVGAIACRRPCRVGADAGDAAAARGVIERRDAAGAAPRRAEDGCQ